MAKVNPDDCYQSPGIGRRCFICKTQPEFIHLPTMYPEYYCEKCCPACAKVKASAKE